MVKRKRTPRASTPAVMRSLAVAPDRPALQHLRTALGAAGYTRDNVRRALQTDHNLTALPGEVVVFEHRLTGRTAVETLIRTFLIGSTVPAEALESSLPAVGLGRREGLGVVERVDGGVRSTIRIIPHGDVVVACDRSYYADPDHQAADAVTGVTSPAILLADLSIRRRTGTALDLGTGGGIQAVLLANHCDRVVAVDINP